MKCPQCGANVFSFDKKCPQCGLPVQAAQPEQPAAPAAPAADASQAAPVNQAAPVYNAAPANNAAPVNNAAPAQAAPAANTQYRSRYSLLLRTWWGGYRGAHLKWLGFDFEAEQIRQQYGLSLSIIFDIPRLIGSMIFQVSECFGVLFGKYPVDAQGVPVVYKPKK